MTVFRMGAPLIAGLALLCVFPAAQQANMT